MFGVPLRAPPLLPLHSSPQQQNRAERRGPQPLTQSACSRRSAQTRACAAAGLPSWPDRNRWSGSAVPQRTKHECRATMDGRLTCGTQEGRCAPIAPTASYVPCPTSLIRPKLSKVKVAATTCRPSRGKNLRITHCRLGQPTEPGQGGLYVVSALKRQLSPLLGYLPAGASHLAIVRQHRPRAAVGVGGRGQPFEVGRGQQGRWEAGRLCTKGRGGGTGHI